MVFPTVWLFRNFPEATGSYVTLMDRAQMYCKANTMIHTTTVPEKHSERKRDGTFPFSWSGTPPRSYKPTEHNQV